MRAKRLTMTVRGIPTPMVAAVKVLPDSGGLRVLVKWRIPASALYQLAPTLHTIGLGLNLRIWKDFFMGGDLLLRPAEGAAN